MRESAFRRLLRWPPRDGRPPHGEIFVSTLLDVAHDENRAAPSPAEIRDAAVHGTAARLDRRFAVLSALSAAALSVVAGVIAATGFGPGILGLLLSTVAPLLTSWSVISVLRLRGVLADGPALVALVASSLAWTLSGLTTLSWSLGFDAADAGLPAPPLAEAWIPLFAAATVIGGVTIAVVVEPVLRRARLPLIGRVVVGGVGGAMLAPLLGLATLSPVTTGAGALAATVLAMKGRSVTPSPPPRPALVIGARARARGRRAARPLAIVAALGGVLGVLYAFSGQLWSPGALDGTMAMAQGITILTLSAVPLLAALVVSAIRPRSSTIGPAAVAALGCGILAVAYAGAPDAAAMWPLMQLSAATIGAAIAWWLVPRVGLSRPAAVTVGVVAGLVYAAFLGVMIGPLLTFGVPVMATVLALRPVVPRTPDVATNQALAAS